MPVDWMWCYENPKEAALEMDELNTRITELENALVNEYRNLVFMIETDIIPNVLNDIIHTETRRVLGEKAEVLTTNLKESQ